MKETLLSPVFVVVVETRCSFTSSRLSSPLFGMTAGEGRTPRVFGSRGAGGPLIRCDGRGGTDASGLRVRRRTGRQGVRVTGKTNLDPLKGGHERFTENSSKMVVLKVYLTTVTYGTDTPTPPMSTKETPYRVAWSCRALRVGLHRRRWTHAGRLDSRFYPFFRRRGRARAVSVTKTHPLV